MGMMMMIICWKECERCRRVHEFQGGQEASFNAAGIPRRTSAKWPSRSSEWIEEQKNQHSTWLIEFMLYVSPLVSKFAEATYNWTSAILHRPFTSLKEIGPDITNRTRAQHWSKRGGNVATAPTEGALRIRVNFHLTQRLTWKHFFAFAHVSVEFSVQSFSS